MAQTSISIRVDEDVKRDVERLLTKLGLTISSATNVFFRQIIRTEGIPFPLSAAETEGSTMEARREFGEAFRAAQEASIINGTSEMTLAEINEIIAECRREAKTK